MNRVDFILKSLHTNLLLIISGVAKPKQKPNPVIKENKSSGKPKQKPSPIIQENKSYIRKRKPINFTLDDLNEDENEDKNWNTSPEAPKTLAASNEPSVKKSRMMPRRSAASKIQTNFSDDDEDDEVSFKEKVIHTYLLDSYFYIDILTVSLLGHATSARDTNVEGG